jgi:hypothetical protein
LALGAAGADSRRRRFRGLGGGLVAGTPGPEPAQHSAQGAPCAARSLSRALRAHANCPAERTRRRRRGKQRRPAMSHLTKRKAYRPSSLLDGAPGIKGAQGRELTDHAAALVAGPKSVRGRIRGVPGSIPSSSVSDASGPPSVAHRGRRAPRRGVSDREGECTNVTRPTHSHSQPASRLVRPARCGKPKNLLLWNKVFAPEKEEYTAENNEG